MTLAAMSWWAAALNTVPSQIALPMAVASHVLYLRDGRTAHVWASAGWVLFGMVFFVKAALIPVVLLLVTAGYFTKQRGWRLPWATVREYRTAWTVHGVLLAGYATLYLLRLRTSARGPSLPPPEDVLTFARLLLTRTFTTTALGGPGDWFPISAGDAAVAAPSGPLTLAAGIVFLLLITASVLLRRRAGWSWVTLGAYLMLAGVLPVALGRLTEGYVELAGAETRYIADAAPVLALCLALAFLPVLGERDAYRRAVAREGTAGLRASWSRWARGLTALGMAGFAAGAAWSSAELIQTVDTTPARVFLAGAERSLRSASPDADVFDRELPPFLARPLFKEYARASRALAPFARPVHRATMRDQPPSAEPLVLDDRGRLRPLRIWGKTYRLPDGCWPTRDDGATVPVEDPTGRDDRYVARMEYISGVAQPVTVWLGSGRVDLMLEPGLHAVTFGLTGRGDMIRVTGDRSGPAFQICALALGFGVAG
jgi:hypothetical protein